MPTNRGNQGAAVSPLSHQRHIFLHTDVLDMIQAAELVYPYLGVFHASELLMVFDAEFTLIKDIPVVLSPREDGEPPTGLPPAPSPLPMPSATLLGVVCLAVHIHTHHIRPPPSLQSCRTRS